MVGECREGFLKGAGIVGMSLAGTAVGGELCCTIKMYIYGVLCHLPFFLRIASGSALVKR
jgi:hypothetical protein